VLVEDDGDEAGGQVAAVVRLEVHHCPFAHGCGSFQLERFDTSEFVLIRLGPSVAFGVGEHNPAS
jgi:hypothetical protein